MNLPAEMRAWEAADAWVSVQVQPDGSDRADRALEDLRDDRVNGAAVLVP